MKKTTLILGLAALTVLGATSCQSFKDGEGGMQYKIVNDEGNTKIKEGDFVSLGAVITTESDSVLNSSYEMEQPFYLAAQKPMYPGDIFTALTMLGEGDSAVFKLNIDSMVSKSGQPKPPFKGDYIVHTFKINKVIPKGDLTDSLFNIEVEKYINQDREKAKNAEAGKIEGYIKKNKLDVQTTSSGLKYQVEKEGEGNKPNVGDTVVVHYTGRFLGGKVFDTSVKKEAEDAGVYNQMREPYEPMKLPVGIGAVVPGWDEGLALLSKGAKATLVLPSDLAYGEHGSMGIQPYTPLAFEVEVIDIIPQKGGAAPTAATPAK
ncbi:FKBP-type peptidyl-prolyl cis-trans isomerase [Olivibacter sp. SDN3]|uniref:FKBP-type peptidyl-prolyl cis-trans isomerase n=1 Tax=Olivibacter sp. SDN3 TaxID=2764720 RepID=UPI0016516A5C|nr:FKBP-type peptidyl-prolyl cis-trans isomerase [Olivibacter sp. SDN3]QNL50997.1 FKBP-type peptidyl-prolyl cis-trans isomerase [Olivibacter sp. SDN3]